MKGVFIVFSLFSFCILIFVVVVVLLQWPHSLYLPNVVIVVILVAISYHNKDRGKKIKKIAYVQFLQKVSFAIFIALPKVTTFNKGVAQIGARQHI